MSPAAMGWRLPHQLSSQHVVTWALQARVRFQALPARRRHTTIAAALVGLLLLLAWGAQQARQREQLERQRQAALAVPITTVTALGRLEPESRVINLAPPAGSVQLAQGRLKSLLVEEGDQVRQGQLLATMDSLPRLSRAVDEAAAQVAIAETQLRVASASLRSDLQTQRAKVRRAEANLRTEAAEEQRYRDLFRNGATSASVYEGQRLRLETARAELAESQSRLQRLQVQVATPEGQFNLDEASARRELQAARSRLARARAEREDALVRAPISGRVLSILTRPGERSGADGILQLGRTERMQLVAEVYQSDRGRLRVGQPVRITSPALTTPLHGQVIRIGAIVQRQSLINTDPSANTDTRVIEVHALLDPVSSLAAADLSNLQVTAVFGP